MRKYPNFIWIAVFLLAMAVLPVFGDENKALEGFRAAFEKRMNAELDEYGLKARNLRLQYIEALKKLKAEFASEENLKGAVLVMDELEAIEGGEEVAELPKNTDRRYRRMREKWDEGLQAIFKERGKKVKKTANLYLTALDAEKRKLTRAGKIKEAVLFEEEEKRVQELPEVKAVMAVVEASSGAGPDDLESFLPGKLYSYHRQGQTSRKIHFEEDGKARYPDDRTLIFKWRLRKGTRVVVLSHRKFDGDVELEFSDDGKSYTGRLVGHGKRWGSLESE